MKLTYFFAVLALLVTAPADARSREIYGFSRVDDGLYRGSRPSSKDDFKLLKQHGIKTILSLESSPTSTWPEKHKAKKNGIAFINIPQFAFSPKISDSKVNRILSTMQDESLKPLYIHCRFGRDRTGLAVGLYRIQVQNWTPEAAYEEMLRFGFTTWLMWSLDKYFKSHTTLDSLTLSLQEALDRL